MSQFCQLPLIDLSAQMGSKDPFKRNLSAGAPLMTLMQPSEIFEFVPPSQAARSNIFPYEYQGVVPGTGMDNTADGHLPTVSIRQPEPGRAHVTGHEGAHHWVNPGHHHAVQSWHHRLHHRPEYAYRREHEPYYRHEPEHAYSVHHVLRPHSERAVSRYGNSNRTEERGDGNKVQAMPIPNFSTSPGLEASAGLNSLREQVLYTATAELNRQRPELVLGERGLDPRLACARTVSTILHRALGLGVVDSVYNLEREMQAAHGRGHFERFAWNGSSSSLQPFDVLVGHRGMGEHSHAAIYTGNGEMFNNNAAHRNLQFDSVSVFDRKQTDRNRFGYASTSVYRWVPDSALDA